MKKLAAVLLALVSLIGISFSFTGCRNGGTEEVKVRIYDLSSAYNEMGWIDENDLKSIACRQYDCYEIQENPYSGLYKQKMQLSAKEERDFKKGYCDYYNYNNNRKEPDLLKPSDVVITNYYGAYEDNVVAEIVLFNEESVIAEEKTHIGGVEFLWDYERKIYVLHYVEDRPTNLIVRGRLYNMSKAYEEGLLGENDLKSLACFDYDRYSTEENPYSGMYAQPEEKLGKEKIAEIKQAYREQIDRQPDADLEYVNIYKYYGTYNGYIVVGMSSDSCKFGYTPVNEIGGVTSPGWGGTYLFRPYSDMV